MIEFFDPYAPLPVVDPGTLEVVDLIVAVAEHFLGWKVKKNLIDEIMWFDGRNWYYSFDPIENLKDTALVLQKSIENGLTVSIDPASGWMTVVLKKGGFSFVSSDSDWRRALCEAALESIQKGNENEGH